MGREVGIYAATGPVETLAVPPLCDGLPAEVEIGWTWTEPGGGVGFPAAAVPLPRATAATARATLKPTGLNIAVPPVYRVVTH
jgi:hypothetical protein